jgi:GTP-binding protein Era
VWTQDDTKVLKLIQDNIALNHKNSPLLLVINKIDKLLHKDQLLPFVAEISQKFSFAHIVPLAALTRYNLAVLEKNITNYLPEAAHIFTHDQLTDKDKQFQVAEIIREQIMVHTGQELPYSATVSISDWQQTAKILTISALISVKRSGQRRIIIGHNGHKLKNIGIGARIGIEKLLQCKVMLHLWVKVQE